MARIKTSQECDCSTCKGSEKPPDGQYGGWICSCMCHSHNTRSKEAGFFNLMGSMCANEDKAKALTDDQLADGLIEKIGGDLSIDSIECSMLDQAIERLRKLSRLTKAAQDLITKLEEVHNDPQYQSVWHLAYAHSARQYDGPNYKTELTMLIEAMKDRDESTNT